MRRHADSFRQVPAERCARARLRTATRASIRFRSGIAPRLGRIAFRRCANLRTRAARARLSTGSSRVFARSIGVSVSRASRGTDFVHAHSPLRPRLANAASTALTK